MHNLVAKIENFLYEYNLLNSCILVGFSGGFDSICLLDALNILSKKYKFKIVALHLNHNWRGKEADKEADNCLKYCKLNEIEFIQEKLENCKKTEEAAREKRYKFFEKYAMKFQNSVVLTAHNADDNAETLIYRMIKGTGITGLQGILPCVKKGGVEFYRPLLEIYRTDIENYCVTKNLKPNVDSSNCDVKFKRNFIRTILLPEFKKINPKTQYAINSLSKIAVQQTNIVKEYLSKIPYKNAENKIITQVFVQQSQDVKFEIIYQFCLENQIDYDNEKIINIKNFIEENCKLKNEKLFSLTSNFWLVVNDKFIYAKKNLACKKITKEIKIDKEGDYQFNNHIFSIKKCEIKPKKYPVETATKAYVYIKKIDFTLRTRRDGDMINPFGMNGSMKLKKFLNLKAIPRQKRDEMLFLCCENEIFWAIEAGLSDKLKVVNNPNYVLELKPIK